MDEDTILTTDNAILDSIGEGDEQSTSESSVEQVDGEDTNTTEETSTASSEQGVEGSSDTEQQGKVSSPQDLVDAQGNVIATGGKERRFYETAQREKQRAEGLTREVETLQAQLEAINNAGSVGSQYDLSPEEVTTGAQIIAAYKNNPVETIEYMLTQAQASGHNVDAIGQNGNMNLNAVKQMVDSAIQPLVAEQYEREEIEAANDRAQEIYDNFNSQYPDSAVHEDSLARLLEQEPSLSPEAAYFKLRSYYMERNLDWTKSLEQLQSEQSSQQASANTQQAVPDGNVISNRVTDTAQVADANTSTDDIIRQAMSDAGIN
jgi:hypothetical protein|tara:strand:+ start:878 stop:1837 length:960 start_codon:yes stop_codon:yes gene_type:complete